MWSRVLWRERGLWALGIIEMGESFYGFMNALERARAVVFYVACVTPIALIRYLWQRATVIFTVGAVL